MTIKAYLKEHENVKKFYVQCSGEVCECDRDSFDDMMIFGSFKIKAVETPEDAGELVTLCV